MKAKMNNALSIDLEFWYSPELLRNRINYIDRDFIEDMTNPLLDLLSKNNTKATFFVLGEVAEKYPLVIKKIYDEGHEIASHSFSHRPLYEMERFEFESEIKKSIAVLEKITMERPVGFRAPTFSLDNSTRWALDVLINHGFKYDSSIFPIETRLYGVKNSPLGIYRPQLDNITQKDPNGKIIEFPMTVFEKIVRIPVSGGFYFRFIPYLIFKSLLKNINKTRPGIIYLHPWETYKLTPRLDLPIMSRFITYYGINSTMKKLSILLRDFSFKPVRDILEL
jgi:polysaccharide deacetylase family protein (PEP-CTERM system associated)